MSRKLSEDAVGPRSPPIGAARRKVTAVLSRADIYTRGQPVWTLVTVFRSWQLLSCYDITADGASSSSSSSSSSPLLLIADSLPAPRGCRVRRTRSFAAMQPRSSRLLTCNLEINEVCRTNSDRHCPLPNYRLNNTRDASQTVEK